MCAGCFAWCLLHLPSGPKKQITKTKSPQRVENSPPAIAPSTSVKNQVIKPKSKDTVVPTTKDYALATGREVLTALQSAASLIPVPFLQDAVGMALEGALVVEEKVKDLQVKVSNIVIAIVDRVTLKDEQVSKEAIVEIAGGVIEEDF